MSKRVRLKFNLITAAFAISLGFAAEGAEIVYYNQSIRQLGMGGVYAFKDTDASSFLQNPAFTCHLKGMNWTILNLGFGINGLQIYNDVKDVDFSGGLSAFSNLYGKNIWVGGGGNTTFTLPCFGVSGYGGLTTSLRLENPAYPRLNTQLIYDYGFALGGAIPLTDVLSLGLSAKRVNRRGGTQAFGPEFLNDLESSTSIVSAFENEGVGYGLDVGLAARFDKVPLNPTFHVGMRDAGSLTFQRTKGTDAPDGNTSNTFLGFSFDTDLFVAGLAGGLEYRNINKSGEQLGKKIHTGLEISLLMFDLRAGFSQGYTTYGLGTSLGIFQLDVATYSVERGVYPGQTEDSRIQGALSVEIGFDPSFNFVDLGGKRRKMKQRR